jgi:cell wall-associated NlpC family hydrolase
MDLNRRQFVSLATLASVIAATDLASMAVVAAESKEDKVVRIAKTYIGNTNYFVSVEETYCQKLCNDVYRQAGYDFKRYGSAAAAADAMRSRIQGTSKKGCLMYWGSWNSNIYGHAAIFLGNGQVLTSYTYNQNKKVAIVSHDEILKKLPKSAWRGYLHIGDAIRFK